MNHPLRIPASELARYVARAKKSARSRARTKEARKPTGPVQTERVSFTVEGKPRGKGRPRFSKKSGAAYTPAQTVAYERQIKSAAREAMGNCLPMDGPVAVAVRAVFAVPKSWPKWKRNAALNGEIPPTVKPDVDNAIKGVLDACNRTLWNDDVQVVEANITKEYGERPYLHIIARPLFKSPSVAPGETSLDDHSPIPSSSGSPILRELNQDPSLPTEGRLSSHR